MTILGLYCGQMGNAGNFRWRPRAGLGTILSQSLACGRDRNVILPRSHLSSFHVAASLSK